MTEVTPERLKGFFSQVMDKLSDLEVSARKLPNQHLADLIKASHGRLVSAAGHPDMDLLALQIERDHRDGMPDGRELPPAKEPPPANQGAFPDQKPFPGGDGKTFHPGDPKFDQANRNPNFQDPNNVDLNADGTLKNAPNAFSREDKRS